MEISYLKYLTLSVIVFVITYITGHWFYSVFNTHKTSGISVEFKKNLFGLWFIAVTYSVAMTAFFTIHTGFVLAFGYWFFCVRDKTARQKLKINYSSFLFQLLSVVSVYTFLYFRLFNPFTGTLYNLQVNMAIYAADIQRLNITGVESIDTDFYFKEPIRSIYHYTELWYAAFFSRVLRINALKCLFLVIWPVALSVFSLGILAVIEQLRKDPKTKMRFAEYLLALSALFLTPLYFYLPEAISFFNTDWGTGSVLGSPKNCFYGHSLLLAVVYLLNRKYVHFILVFLLGIYINVITIPAVFITAVLFSGFLLYRQKIRMKEAVRYLVPVFITLLFLLIFLMLIRQFNHPYTDKDILLYPVVNEHLLAGYYKLVFNNFAGLVIKLILSIAPFLPFVLFYKNRSIYTESDRHLLMFLVAFIISAMASFSIFYFLVDGIQLFTMVYQSAMALLLVFILHNILTHNRMLFLVLWLLLFTGCIYQNIIKGPDFGKSDISYLDIVRKSAGNDEKIFFATYLTPGKEPTTVAGINYNMYVPFDNLRLYFDNYHPICLSAYDVVFSKDEFVKEYQESILKNSTLFKYVKRQKADGSFRSIEESQLGLIRKANIKYIIKDRQARLPASIQQLTDKRFMNSNSTYEFIILRDTEH